MRAPLRIGVLTVALILGGSLAGCNQKPPLHRQTREEYDREAALVVSQTSQSDAEFPTHVAAEELDRVHAAEAAVTIAQAELRIAVAKYRIQVEAAKKSAPCTQGAS